MPCIGPIQRGCPQWWWRLTERSSNGRVARFQSRATSHVNLGPASVVRIHPTVALLHIVLEYRHTERPLTVVEDGGGREWYGMASLVVPPVTTLQNIQLYLNLPKQEYIYNTNSQSITRQHTSVSPPSAQPQLRSLNNSYDRNVFPIRLPSDPNALLPSHRR